VLVDERGAGFVLGPEGDLGFGFRIEVEAEQLVVAADAREIDQELAVG